MSDADRQDSNIDAQNPDIQQGISEEIQERLNAVIAQAQDRDQSFGQFSQQVAATNDRIARIEAAIQQLAAGAQAPSQPKAETNLQSLLRPAANAGAPASGQLDIAALVKTAVAEAVSPILQRDAARDAQSALRAQQEASFAKAAKILPGLKNETSRESQLFDRIIDSRKDLSGLPDAPMLVATMVQGLLAGERKEQVQQTAIKRSLTNPSPVSAAPRTAAPRAPADLEEVKEIREQLLQKGQDQGLKTQDLADLIRTQLTMQFTKEE